MAIPAETTLLNRVKLGNAKLNGAWLEARTVADDVQNWTRIMEMIERARPRLDLLCMALKSWGYHDCLYQNGERTKCFEDDGRFCWVCPKQPCYMCGGYSWWWRQNRWAKNGEWLCARCYPPPCKENHQLGSIKTFSPRVSNATPVPTPIATMTPPLPDIPYKLPGENNQTAITQIASISSPEKEGKHESSLSTLRTTG